MLTVLLAAAQQVPPPPPPIVSAVPVAAPSSEPSIVDYGLAEVRCRGEVEAPRMAASPLPFAVFTSATSTPVPVQIAFRIDADGRPLGIGIANRGEGSPGYYPISDDLAPALAASRFAPGSERRGCVATYAPRAMPVAAAPVETLHRYIALPRIGGAAWQPALKRLREEAPGCFKPGPPRPLLQGYPDFDAIPLPPGTLAYTTVGFDIDAKGVPVRVRTLSSDGNAAFDRAAIAAIAKSRYAAQARTGCSYPYFRRQTEPLAPPRMPERETFVTTGATCDNSERWSKLPPLVFPEPFRRRIIEGWAVIRFDVAPWGGTGNIEVLASEPAAAFGEAARRVIAGATRPASATGATGCVDRVRFKMGNQGDASEPPPPPF